VSGIAGIVNLDGGPVDRSLLRRLTETLRHRGPDAVDVWIDGPVGFGHALLRTTGEGQRESQPSTLDGEVWITADARVDARADLVRALRASDRTASVEGSDLESATDDTLLLHAYRAWGERCAEHLLGDFAFAIWDRPRRRLFCARDQLGVKPFFYAVTGTCLIFASDLDCVRRHPDVPGDLNDLAIADFLMWGGNRELDTTAFTAVRRLTPAHTLTREGAGPPRVGRYWELSVPDETRYRRARDYVEHFNDLLGAAVSDRLRTDRVGILMSGGVDSPSVAAAAKSVFAGRPGGLDMRAHTIIYESLMPDEERHYAGLVADALAMPIHYHPGERYPLFAGWDEPGLGTPEPSPDLWPRFEIDLMHAIATHSRVALTGYDGDALCQLWLPSHFRRLLDSLRLKRALADATSFAGMKRTLPPIAMRTRLRERRRQRQATLGFPGWINPSLVARLGLRERWQQFAAPQRPVGRPVRADAVELLTGAALQNLLNSYDPALTKSAVAVRHPLLDLRIVSFVLSLPPLPWCVDKTILRKALGETLPASICRRPKAPLAEDPAEARLRRPGGCSTMDSEPSPLMSRYVLAGALPPVRAVQGSKLLWPRLWVDCLDRWLVAHPAEDPRRA
jgi:asparagine synthase (glutamine-hydrolysing)